jgi:uncharacterized protein YajQ (UPF0234 family)
MEELRVTATVKDDLQICHRLTFRANSFSLPLTSHC